MRMETRQRAIDKVYKRRDRIDMPDFQREIVWQDDKKRLLIDTIIKNWHLPKFYFRKLDDGTFVCVDGQQRLVSIFEFCEDRLTLSPEMAKEYGGSKYSELPDDISDEFDDYVIDIEEIEDATEKELEELFQRLQLGTPLNAAEKLNAISGDMRTFCRKAAAQPFFKDKVALQNIRYAHFEIVTKWAFVESRGIQPQMRFPQLKQFFKEHQTFSEQSEIGRKISGALSFLDKAFPTRCSYIRNRANALSICMLAARVVEQGLDNNLAASDFRKFVENFFGKLSSEVEKGVKALDKELTRYQQAITSGSSGGDSIKTRINILTKRLASFSPRFSSLLGTYQEAGDEAIRDIREVSSTAREKLFKTNQRYAASAGQDLFKMTNVSSSALSTIIPKPCHDISQYGDFVDALYFLIYEGSGDCKRLPRPVPSFAMDVKLLRVALRHDLDHGDEQGAKSKRLRSAEVFRKYSGKKTPEECSSDDFLAVQLRILNEMVTFLDSLP